MKKIIVSFVMSAIFGAFLAADERENRVAGELFDTFKKHSFFMKSKVAQESYIDRCVEQVKQACREQKLDYEKVIEQCLNLVNSEVKYYKSLDEDRYYSIGLSMLAASAFFGVCSYFLYPHAAREKKEMLEKRMYEIGVDISDAEFVDLYGQWRKLRTSSEGSVGCGIIAGSCAFTGMLALCDKKYSQYYYQKYYCIQNRLKKYAQLFPSNVRKDLIESIKSHDLEAVKNCIERGADIHSKDDKEYTPLYYAIEVGDLAIVELLIVHGATIQLTTKNGSTPYSCAFDRGHTEICTLLKEKNGYTVLDAVHCSDIQALEQCIVHDSKSVQENMNLLFYKAVCKGDITILELLLQHGANVHGSLDRLTYFEAAIMSRQIHSIEFLIKHGVDIHARGLGGWQPIHTAMIVPGLEIVKILIAAGASVQSQTPDGATPLRIILTLWCSNPNMPCNEETEKVVTYLRSLI